MRLGISKDGKAISEYQILPTPKEFEEGIQTLVQTAAKLSGGGKFEAVAGGIAGPLDSEKTMLVKGPHIAGWVQKPFKKSLEEAFSCPVYLENDADLAGLGEASFGAGIDENIVVYLTISTGVGGVRITDEQIDINALGFEPGHQIIVPDGNECQCGGKGHLEAYIGGYYLEKIHGKKAENIDDPNVWEQVANYLAIGLHNSIVHWSPDIIVLGGSVTQSIPLDKVKEKLAELLTIFPSSPDIVKSSLGDRAGLFGALKLLT